jgi:hypothetical protein
VGDLTDGQDRGERLLSRNRPALLLLLLLLLLLPHRTTMHALSRCDCDVYYYVCLRTKCCDQNMCVCVDGRGVGGYRTQAVRQEELWLLRKAAIYKALNFTLMASSPMIITIVTLALYGALGNELTASVAFTTFALLNILKQVRGLCQPIECTDTTHRPYVHAVHN